MICDQSFAGGKILPSATPPVVLFPLFLLCLKLKIPHSRFFALTPAYYEPLLKTDIGIHIHEITSLHPMALGLSPT